jgi:hypothetical protein
LLLTSSVFSQQFRIQNLTLQNNGGATWTHALRADSPAINAGNNNTTSVTIDDLGGLGRGNKPSDQAIAELDTLKFEGAGLTAHNMLLRQRSQDLEITFEGVGDTAVRLRTLLTRQLKRVCYGARVACPITNPLLIQTKSKVAGLIQRFSDR